MKKRNGTSNLALHIGEGLEYLVEGIQLEELKLSDTGRTKQVLLLASMTQIAASTAIRIRVVPCLNTNILNKLLGTRCLQIFQSSIHDMLKI